MLTIINMGTEKKYKITVSSAEEAISVLKKNFDDRAKVLSVRQIEGKGLSRFLRKPKLEVIVVVSDKKMGEVKPLVSTKPIAPVPAVLEKTYNQTFESKKSDIGGPKIEIQNLLLKSGFDPLLVQEFFLKEGSVTKNNSWQRNLNLFLQYLQNAYNQLVFQPVSERVAFIGPSGVGKTLSLCKLLAQEVFIDRQHPCVVQLNGDQPKGQEALGIFCDILSVPFFQEGMQEIPEILPQQRCFFDSEGIDFCDPEEISQLNCKLNQNNVTTRILVLNALYETSFLDFCFEQAARLNATHCVLTHVDECINTIKLWKYILKGGLSPYFFSCGQNLTSDYTTQMFSFLIDKTLSHL